MPVIIAILVILLIAYIGVRAFGLISELLTQQSSSVAALLASIEEIKAKPLSEVQSEVERIWDTMQDVEYMGKVTPNDVAVYSSTLQKFFLERGIVEVAGTELSPNLEQSEWLSPYILIGLLNDGHTYLTTLPHEDRIFEIGDDTTKENIEEDAYPTIYHWLLQVFKTEEWLEETTSRGPQ
jgi:hypothetical protein